MPAVGSNAFGSDAFDFVHSRNPPERPTDCAASCFASKKTERSGRNLRLTASDDAEVKKQPPADDGRSW